MQEFRKTVFLMIPAFIYISLFSSSCFVSGKSGYSPGHHHDCNLPPGLAKKGKVPPGWAKKCGHQKVKHGRYPKHNRDYYPDHDHKRTSGGHDKPYGEVDIGAGVHIPFP